LRIQPITQEEYGIYQCQVDSAGNTLFSRKVIIDDGITGINDDQLHTSQTPSAFKLLQNYPNPFNPVTTIQYQLPQAETVRLVIYDVMGRQVRELVNERQTAGYYNITLDASDLSSGVYFYHLKAGEFSQTRKFLLTK